MEESIVLNKSDEALDLPAGFRFHPNDDEIITCYLINKVLNSTFSAIAIGEADLNKCEPWDLPKKAKMGEKDWYFFCQRDRKYPTGTRTNRATESGYWKATGKDKEIYKGKSNQLIGMKKTLVFYKGRAPRGEKTNWVMHEFRLDGKLATCNLPKDAKDEWVVSRIFNKNINNEVKRTTSISNLLRINSISDDLLDFSSLPPLVEPPFSNNTIIDHHDFKGTNSSPSSSNGYYFPSYLINNEINHVTNQGNFNNPMQKSTFSSHQPQPQPQIQIPKAPMNKNMLTNLYSYMNQGNNNSNGYIYGLENKECKMEQFSTNNSMVSVSQDTCLSNDINNDISSMVSKQENMGMDTTLYEELECPSSIGPLSNFEYLWDNY